MALSVREIYSEEHYTFLVFHFLFVTEVKTTKLHMKKKFNEESLTADNRIICYVFIVLFSYLCSL